MIGIDLGTAFSCAMWVDRNGAPRPIPVDKGRRSFASNVYVRGDRILLGNQAREHQETAPANVIHSWKRLLGRRYQSAAVRDAIAHAAYPIEETPSGDAVVRIDDVAWSPAWFAARVLYEIRVWTRDCLDEVVDSAVITVPAFYTAPQRAAVKEAAAIAGFQHVRLLHEPVAAAIAYGVGREMSQRILVYDLGGGTFDVTLVEVEGNVFQVSATGGDAYLGGVDFDDRIMGHLLVSFLNETQVNLANDVLALSRIRVASERAKLELSERPSTRVTIPYIAKRGETPLRLDVELTRDTFEQLTQDLVERTLACCDRVLEHAKLTRDDIDEVLLVGGMTRALAVRSRVEQHFGKAPRHGVHPDEAVAAGAALFAASLGQADSIAVLDVLSMAIGVEGAPGQMHVLIDAKSALPAQRDVEITAVADGQTAVEIEVFQGASTLIANCEYIGSLKVDWLPPVAAGLLLCRVRFRLDAEGALTLEAFDSTGASHGSVRIVTARQKQLPSAETGRGRGFFARLLGLRR